MTQTTNYKLNQWAPEDRILRENFNADNQKIDAALAGAASGLAQERTDRANAVTGAKSEAAAAVAAEKTAREKAVSAEKTARQQAIAPLALVKLADITTTADAQQVDIDVSAWPLANYAQLIIFQRLNIQTVSSDGNITVRLNGISDDGAYRDISYDTDCLFHTLYTDFGKNASVLRLSGVGNVIYCHATELYLSDIQRIGGNEIYSAIKPGYLKTDQLKTINFITSYRNDLIKAGSRILIYGIKL